MAAGVAVLAALAVGSPFLTGAAHGPAEAPSESQGGKRVGTGAPTLLKRLNVTGPQSALPYRRAGFGPGLSSADPDKDGCQTREEIMARDLDVTELADDDCNVLAGTLTDPYTGKGITYRESDSQAVQIDHIYALSQAWRMGADAWPKEKRVRFANDPRNLLAVDGPTNASKGDSGPGEWAPLNKGFRCTYARKYVQVAYAYKLPVSRADKDALALTFEGCR